MNIKPLGSNKTELHLDGMTVLFSYQTPVACWINGEYFMTEKKWSRTTSKHINSWVDTNWVSQKPQSFFDDLVGGV